MLSKDELVAQMNREIPAGVNWKAGAERYVASCFEKMGRETIELYSANKPFGTVASDDPAPAIVECVHYLNNFANALALLKPRLGSRVLDVACGGGWVSHYLSKLGYWTFGIDISSDFIDLARHRLAGDPSLKLTSSDAASRFQVLDIEAARLPEHLRGTFDIIWLESCLHHFVDPVEALEHLAEGLSPDGIIVLIEFENRIAGIKDEYMQVMREFDTLERPYARWELENALDLVGLSEREFVGSVNGWYSPLDPSTAYLGQATISGADQMNLAICSRRPERLDALFPHRLRHDSMASRGAAAVKFGAGFYPNENGFRWCGPSGEFTVARDIPNAAFDVVSMPLSGDGRTQTIVAYGPRGELSRVTLSAGQSSQTLHMGHLAAGDVVSLHCSEAFRPSWAGSADTRLLSFYVRTDD
ncbi:class I SAM-dependent methyltransferase [Burkholderia sp. BCCIQ04A]|uniref:Class I SAM-dependent methyltransferase n=1 Tax=Burkholderia anthinoferrum TaxID=3090833 RepID=A0ABU5WYC2_9BURK|nr:class I SAM-dependent methyltransferase [Burkholderia anthinoferrum]MEB2504653.1 class I SAM-dependent methyltransferase [Burkholderia anthinoferrum]MEB2530321.1 class I SAM-dependent methyltransferase [Burkholderia anthinoferrum]MEB2561694.1 class I SAM-dependent methyltransferase [Burkholderia anthinoferrum]MEB2583929.1 class I SAM-dependent methyltransferase [Burkholderia anthinoferrum]MEB2634466.1 class I SAM-dependent methyltransferase [Burkholderia anthinoferrum]